MIGTPHFSHTAFANQIVKFVAAKLFGIGLLQLALCLVRFVFEVIDMLADGFCCMIGLLFGCDLQHVEAVFDLLQLILHPLGEF